MVSMLVFRFGLQRFLRADEKTQSTRGFSGAIFRGSTFHLSLENAAKSPRFFPGVPTYYPQKISVINVPFILTVQDFAL